MSKIWNKHTIGTLAGFLAYTVTILVLFIPFKGEPSMSLINWWSPLGILVILLFIVSVILYIYSIFKKERILTPKENLENFEKRKELLPKLKSIIESKIIKLEELRNIAVDYPLTSYANKYLATNKRFQKNIKKYPHNILMAIMLSLDSVGFVVDNLYYADLIRNDKSLQQLETEYTIFYSQVKDKRLKSLLSDFWGILRKENSCFIYSEQLKHNSINVPSYVRIMTLGENIQLIAERKGLNIIMNRIKELSDGDDDER